METDWSKQVLRRFVNAVDSFDEAEAVVASRGDWRDYDARRVANDEVLVEEGTARRVLEVVRPGCTQSLPAGGGTGWAALRSLAVVALGDLRYADQVEQNLGPVGPVMAATGLHPWVWESARSLWGGSHWSQAISNAAAKVNNELQAKIERFDISDTELVREAFTRDDPKVGRPRMRFPGNREDRTWISRQDGAREFGAGCFVGVRNPATHDPDHPMTEQRALESLAAFSLLARWIDDCEVEREAE